MNSNTVTFTFLDSCNGYLHPKVSAPRNVAQFGRAPGLGPGGRRFKSCHSDSLAMNLFLTLEYGEADATLVLMHVRPGVIRYEVHDWHRLTGVRCVVKRGLEGFRNLSKKIITCRWIKRNLLNE